MSPTKKTAETFKIDLVFPYFLWSQGSNNLIIAGIFWMDVEHYKKETGQDLLSDDKNVIGENEKDVIYFIFGAIPHR